MCGGSDALWHTQHMGRRAEVREARPGDLAVLLPEGTELGDPTLQALTEEHDRFGRPVFRAVGSLPCASIALVVQRMSLGDPDADGLDKLLVTCDQRVGWVDWIDVERVIRQEDAL